MKKRTGSLDLRRRLGILLVCVWLSLVMPVSGFAQSGAFAAGVVSFDVASVRNNRSSSGDASMRTSHGLLTARNVTVRMLMQAAFDVKAFQIVGGPAWAGSQRFDIEARTGRIDISDDDLWKLLQPLLAERFDLKFHRSTKELPVYSLVVGSERPKLQVHSNDDEPSMRIAAGSGKVLAEGHNVTLAKFADSLSGFLDHTVVDNTGLEGKYDVRLEWDDEHRGGRSASLGTAYRRGRTGQTIFTAVQEQLGLRLEAREGAVGVIVIDSVERPAGN